LAEALPSNARSVGPFGRFERQREVVRDRESFRFVSVRAGTRRFRAGFAPVSRKTGNWGLLISATAKMPAAMGEMGERESRCAE
jgi:hypothetical protein